MNAYSLRTIIDDILLLVRNNNISESEDFSRAQIRAWVMQYKAALMKKQKENEEATEIPDYDDSLTETIGPIELEIVKSLDANNLYTRKTKEKLPNVYDDSSVSIISVTDQSGYPIQKMSQQRRKFHWFRKYTRSELTYYYDDGYIYIQGNEDCMKLKYIYITGMWDKDDSDDVSEDDITIPGWMIPLIKQNIIKNELALMLKMPSDDTNNATLQGIKPDLYGHKDEER